MTYVYEMHEINSHTNEVFLIYLSISLQFFISIAAVLLQKKSRGFSSESIVFG